MEDPPWLLSGLSQVINLITLFKRGLYCRADCEIYALRFKATMSLMTHYFNYSVLKYTLELTLTWLLNLDENFTLGYYYAKGISLSSTDLLIK
jgi:hypothetical protein